MAAPKREGIRPVCLQAVPWFFLQDAIPERGCCWFPVRSAEVSSASRTLHSLESPHTTAHPAKGRGWPTKEFTGCIRVHQKFTSGNTPTARPLRGLLPSPARGRAVHGDSPGSRARGAGTGFWQGVHTGGRERISPLELYRWRIATLGGGSPGDGTLQEATWKRRGQFIKTPATARVRMGVGAWQCNHPGIHPGLEVLV